MLNLLIAFTPLAAAKADSSNGPANKSLIIEPEVELIEGLPRVKSNIQNFITKGLNKPLKTLLAEAKMNRLAPPYPILRAWLINQVWELKKVAKVAGDAAMKNRKLNLANSPDFELFLEYLKQPGDSMFERCTKEERKNLSQIIEELKGLGPDSD